MNDALQGRVQRLERRLSALEFAREAHAGQIYRGHGGREDQPYIFHPIRVMSRVTKRARNVALLHDCLEDAGMLPDWLMETERAAINLLTRTSKGEPGEYAAYIARLASATGEAGEIAREVKIADLRDNLAHDPPERLRTRYEAALAVLAPLATNPEPASVDTGERAQSGDT